MIIQKVTEQNNLEKISKEASKMMSNIDKFCPMFTDIVPYYWILPNIDRYWQTLSNIVGYILTF